MTCPWSLTLGIIPAYAGNTFIADVMHAGHGDHPRVCGEHLHRAARVGTRAGSSPRMRGTLSNALPVALCTGIIPAYAGNTLAFASRIGSWWDHPRVCGEHRAQDLGHEAQAGSSPRMRGTH